MIAEPVFDYVWCEECGEPHPVDFNSDPPTIMADENMGCIPRVFVEHLPADWERKYFASYSVDRKGTTTGYDLMELRPVLAPHHYPMYYLRDPNE